MERFFVVIIFAILTGLKVAYSDSGFSLGAFIVISSISFVLIFVLSEIFIKIFK